jgi:predicted ArsR family transcriptional regulator
MSHDPLPRFVPAPPPPSPRLLPDHPIRLSLLDLLAERGTVTSTEAAVRLGHSSGLCSFHLRQLARYGLIEEVPAVGGRAKPWRLRWEDATTETAAAGEEDGSADLAAQADFALLTRELENESHDRWLAHRDRAPAEWRRDDSFSTVVYLTPDEAAELAATLHDQVRLYASRDGRTASQRPANAVAVAVVGRVFPFLTAREEQD